MNILGVISLDIGDNLAPNLLTMLTQLASTGVLFLLFRKYLYRPVLAYIEKRNEAEQSRLTQAQTALDEARQLEAKRQQQFKEASQRIAEMMEASKHEAEVVKSKLIAQGEQEIAYRKERAQKDIESQVRDARNQLREETIAVAMMASEKLLKERYDELSDKERIESFVGDIAQ